MQEIVCGDCKEVMVGLADDSVDLIVTDPPYGISFMGRDWDKAVPSVDIWKECLRVLKPGAFAFVMSIPRMDCLSEMGRRLAEASFEIGFTPIFWAYASGFPKATNMSKLIDKRLGAERQVVGKGNRHTGRAFGEGVGDAQFGTYAGGVPDLTAPATPEAHALNGSYSGAQFKPAVEVVIVAQKPDTRKHKRSDVYTLLGAKYDYWYTAHTTVTKDNKAKLEKKWDTLFEKGDIIERRLALAPELDDEVLVNRERVLSSRPYKDSDLTSTITQALDGGKSITWLDDCKIPGPPSVGGAVSGKTAIWGEEGNQTVVSVDRSMPDGRFPANLLVSDDAVDDGKVQKSGVAVRRNIGHSARATVPIGASGSRDNLMREDVGYGDSGSFSRYFSLDSWWAEKLKELPESVQRTFPFVVVPKAGKKEKNLGCEGLDEKPAYDYSTIKKAPGRHGQNTRRTNYHPTVKPLKLMSYLVTLGSRPNDLVLDPFAGTCTTAMATKMLGRQWLMIEISEEWCQIGKRRVEATVARLI